MIKPGYKTSEFWFTFVTFIFSGLYLLGVIGDISQKDELISNVSHAVESVILISGQLVVLYKYVNGRNQIKQSWSETASPEERKVVEKKTVPKEKKNVSRNTSKQTSTTSRKRKNISK